MRVNYCGSVKSILGRVGGDNDDDNDDDDVDDWIEHAVSSGDLWQDTVLGPDLAAQEVDKGVQGT